MRIAFAIQNGLDDRLPGDSAEPGYSSASAPSAFAGCASQLPVRDRCAAANMCASCGFPAAVGTNCAAARSCIADIDAGGIGMHHFQTEICVLDLQRHLSPLLAVHLVPMDVLCIVSCSLRLLWRAGFHATFNQRGPARWAKPTQSLQRGRAVLLCRTTPATIHTIACTGAMLIFGQERSRETSALTAEPC